MHRHSSSKHTVLYRHLLESCASFSILGHEIFNWSSFQAKFDELWRKFNTYTAGEQLFGLPVSEYSTLVKIKKELNLLQKLYGLYNDVIERVNGYYDILWSEVDIDRINNELIDFQNR